MSQYSGQLSPISVDAVLKVIDPASATNVDLHDIRVIKKLGCVYLNMCTPQSKHVSICLFPLFSGTVEDTELVDGLVLEQNVSHIAGGVTRVEKAKIGLIQFCISPPKTDVRGRVLEHIPPSFPVLFSLRWRIK